MVSPRAYDSPEWAARGLAVSSIRAASIGSIFTSPPRVLVVDADGVGVATMAEAWRAHEVLGVPIVVIATSADSDYVVALLQHGADDVIVEPPVPALVAARVGALLRRASSVNRSPFRRATLRLAHVEIDMEARSATSSDGAAPLSQDEFSLLSALLRAGGRTCSHDELKAAVWGTAAEGSAQHLRVCVSRLRRKLGDDAAQPSFVLNHRGIGYRLVLPEPVDISRIISRHPAAVAIRGDTQRSVG